jgi:hypothetical protein
MINTSITTLGELEQFLQNARAVGHDKSTPILFGGAISGVSARVEPVADKSHLIIDENGFDPDNVA